MTPKLTPEKKYQLLLEISRMVRDTFDLDKILRLLLDAVKSVLEYDAAGIFVLNQDLAQGRLEAPRKMIAAVSMRGFDHGHDPDDDMLTHGKGITGYSIRHCESVVVSDVRLDERYVQGRQDTLSEITVPIIQNARAIGALNLESNRVSAYTLDDIEVLQFFADAAAISIEKAMLHQQLLERELIDKQLETARLVQSRLFPGSPPELVGYDIAGVCIPADEIGGDYFDYIPLSHNRLGLAIADVSGHGIPSALVMTAFRALLRTQARGKIGPARIAARLNQLLPEFTGDNHFVTALYAILEVLTGKLTYVSCGHPPPLLLHANGQVDTLVQRNTALGVFQDLPFNDTGVYLAGGDILVLYTDGVTELINPQAENFGIPRLVQVLWDNRGLPATEITNKVVEAAHAFGGSPSFLDDLTLVVVRCEP